MNTDGPQVAPRVLPDVYVYDKNMTLEEALLIWEIIVRVLAQQKQRVPEESP